MFIRLYFNFRHINDSVFPVARHSLPWAGDSFWNLFLPGQRGSGAGVGGAVTLLACCCLVWGREGGGNHCRFQGVCFAVLVVKIKINYLEVLSKGLFISK